MSKNMMSASCAVLALTALFPEPSWSQTAAALAVGGEGQAASTAPSNSPSSARPSTSQEQAYGDIIVTAQKRSERLSDVPLSVTAATSATLTKLGVSSPVDLPKITPGLTYATSGYGAPVYTIRGIGIYDEAAAISPAVSIYVDQVPLPYSRMTLGASLDVERVEILKGPQGTLFGQNNTGGAINYIAAKPTDTFHMGSTISYGRFNDVDATGYVSGPITNTLSARLAVRSEQSGDWQESETSSRTRGAKNFLTGRLLLDWHASDSLKFELNLNGWRDRSETQAAQFRKYAAITPTASDSGGLGNGYEGPFFTPDLLNKIKNSPVVNNDRAADWDADYPSKANNWFYQTSLRGDLELADRLTLTSISSFARLHVDEPHDADGTPYLDLNNDRLASIKSFSQEIRLAGSFGDEHVLKYMLGGNYEHDKTGDQSLIEFDGTNTSLPLPPPIGLFYYGGNGAGLINEGYQKISSKAVFGSLDYNVTRTLTLYGSARYTDSDNHFHGCFRDNGEGRFAQGFGALSYLLNSGNTGFPPTDSPSYIPPGGCVSLDDTTNLPVLFHRQLKENNVSWRTGLAWKITPQTLLYGNVTRGYKSGIFGITPAVRRVQTDPVPQEKVTAYELGFKTALFDRKVNIDGAVFYYQYFHKQLQAYVNTGAIFGDLPGEVSIPKSRVKGAELNIQAEPLHGLSLHAGATYLDTKVTSHYRISSPDALYDLQPGNCGGGLNINACGGVDVKGEAFPYTPKWTVIGDAQYTFPLNSRWNGFVGANASYRTKTSAVFAAPPAGLTALQAFTNPGDYEIKGYALLDLRAGMESADGKWMFQVWGRNVANTYYWTNVNKYQDALIRFTGQPATYGMTISLRY